MLNLKVGGKYININGEIISINKSIYNIKYSVGEYITTKELYSKLDGEIIYVDSKENYYYKDCRSCDNNSNYDLIKECILIYSI